MELRMAEKQDRSSIKALIQMFPDKLMQTHLPTYKSFFVALSGGEIVGCCALQVYSKRLAEVRSLAVHPKWRRNGIAKALVGECLKKAEKLKILEVFAITGARELFEGEGFSIFGHEKFAMLKVLRK